MRSDQSDSEDLRNIALLAVLIVAEAEGELIDFDTPGKGGHARPLRGLKPQPGSEFPAGEPRVSLDDPWATGVDPAGIDFCECGHHRSAHTCASSACKFCDCGRYRPRLVDSDAAATVWLLAQAGVTLQDVGPYLRAERMAS